MDIFARENYLKKIRGFYHDTGMIKVVTGIRRCGKSCLLQSIVKELEGMGIPQENIIFINLDKKDFRFVKEPDQLEKLIDSFPAVKGVKYLFIDEIQNVSGFEELINSYREEGDYSIFITGSNSYLLSGELVTKLTGRYIEFEVFPLTFDEYVEMKKFKNLPVKEDIVAEFDDFMMEGGFPKTLDYKTMEDKRTYVKSITEEIFEKDIKRRAKIRDRASFETVWKYLMNNFGATVSLSNILSDLHKSSSNITKNTLYRYIQILLDAKVLYRCDRFDMKSRKSIRGEEKFYLADLGFYYAFNTDNRIQYGPVLENITYIYAKANGYSISVGRIGKLECDFILRKGNFDYSYVQVTLTMMISLETENREYAPLEMIKDNYPKYILTRNDLIQKRNGILHRNIGQFMKDGTLF